MDGVAYVNGQFTPLAEARVSILDRGFLFGDGVYEVTATLEGRLVDNEAHLARLDRSLKEIGIARPASDEKLLELQRELIARNGLREGIVYIEITRGVAEREFGFPKDTPPSLVMFSQAKDIINSPAARTGVAVKTTPDLRWARRDIKSVALLAQVLAKQAAAEAGCQEAWMVDDRGQVTEGSSSTSFIITRQGAIVARPNSNAILPGCTRRALMALAEREGLAIERRGFDVAEALNAAEAFLSSASTFVTPVVSIDGQPIGAGVPGELTRRLREIYIDFARATAI